MKTMGQRLARDIGELFIWALVILMIATVSSSFWAYWHYVIVPHWRFALGIVAFFVGWYFLAVGISKWANPERKPMATFNVENWISNSDD